MNFYNKVFSVTQSLLYVLRVGHHGWIACLQLRVCDSKERKDVYSFLSTAYKEKIERNRKILLSIVDVIVTLGKRNIGLRGSWDKVKKKEDGNFQFFVDWKAVFD